MYDLIPTHIYQVYRICDVVRGAQSLVIAIGQPPNDRQEINTIDRMLQQWGNRIWTFPEVLLAPGRKDIIVYLRGGDPLRPLRIPKNQFAAKVWHKDANIARQVGVQLNARFTLLTL